MAENAKTVKGAFTELVDVAFTKVEKSMEGLRDKVREARLATLEADLQELDKRKSA